MQETRTIVLIGASGGLGGALCDAFASRSHRIAVHVYKNLAAGERRVMALTQAGCEAALFPADLQDASAVRQMFHAITLQFGPVHLVIYSAGLIRDTLFIKIRPDLWDQMIGVNLSGAFFCLREAGEIMSKNGGGHIINIASLSAYTGPIGQAAYAAAKRGLIALTQTAALEWGKIPIQVNAVLPGFLATPMTDRLTPAQRDKIVQENALGCASTLPEVARFILDLSHMAHVSGQVFNLDSRIHPT